MQHRVSTSRSPRCKYRLHLLLTMFWVILALCVAFYFIFPKECRRWIYGRWEEHAQTALLHTDSVTLQSRRVDMRLRTFRRMPQWLNADGSPVKHNVFSVPAFETAFPDLNDVQLATASRLGIQACVDRDEAIRRGKELVYIADNPFYEVKTLHYSIPYLVPRAATLLEEIGRAFLDSLTVKGIPFHKLVVTSVLRSDDDVARLRQHNANATENSCHRYGTSFDISYNHYIRVQDPTRPRQPEMWAYQLKRVLAEVLRDQRVQGHCYVKYEVHQSCFHITAR